ncbi:DUF6941 family protein [Nonomuraea glycinis]|uniref:DUF6941 family protein n=1 Tax=Nonomuraea glycinis TaxID=2047744 RepID=UPI002E13C847|nr:hypothetical protein OHA68_26565 [Nonomuraea glycinis]
MIEGFLVLSDAASTDVATGKINVLGAGWSVTGPAVSMAAVTGFLRIPWEEVEQKICFVVRLQDEEGQPVRPFAEEDSTLSFSGEFAPNIDQAEPMARRVPLNVSFAIPIPPLPLTAGHVYEWILAANDVEVASVSFVVRAEAPTTGARGEKTAEACRSSSIVE